MDNTPAPAPANMPRSHAGAGSLLPSLAAFLMIDTHDQVVEAELVERFVWSYMNDWPSDKLERLSQDLMDCIHAGNVLMVRAVMMASLRWRRWEGAVESSVPPSPDGTLPPGTIPLQRGFHMTDDAQ